MFPRRCGPGGSEGAGLGAALQVPANLSSRPVAVTVDPRKGYVEERAFEEKKLGTELNGYNRWFCGAGISKRAVPLSGGGTAM